MSEYDRNAFHVASAPRVDALTRVLRPLGLLKEGRVREVRHLYLDTFDWRLFRRDERLKEVRGDGEGPRLVWRKKDTFQSLGRLEGPAPVFAWDLREGVFRERLERILEMRALLKLVSLRSRIRPLELRNGDGKIVVRLHLEQHRAGPLAGGRGGRLAGRLRIVPLKGYTAQARKARALLAATMDLSPAGDLLEEALGVAGMTPAGYTSKMRLDFDAAVPSGAAARSIAKRLLETMKANEQGILDDTDSEFLHDYRVAVRRTRSLLGQLKTVFPAKVLDRFRREFAWLGQITGRPRDMDVHLLAFPSYRRSLSESTSTDLDPLRDFLEEQKREAYRDLAGHFASRRYRRILRDWGHFLEKAGGERKRVAAGSARPVGEVARERTWRIYRRAVKEGKSIGGGSPPEEFHELRKTGKKLRYLLEFFRHLQPPGTAVKLIRSLKLLQDNLGEYQDLQVQAMELRNFSLEMEKDGKVPGRTFLAMGMLVEAKKERQLRVRQEFFTAFAKFNRPRNRSLFARLFAPPRGEAAP